MTSHDKALLLAHQIHDFINDKSFVAGGVIGSFYSWLHGIKVLNLDHIIIDFNQVATLAINTMVGACLTSSIKIGFKYLQKIVTK